MLDATLTCRVGDQSVSISSVSGILAKSSDKSKIVRFHMDSKLSDRFFDLECPYYVKAKGSYSKEKTPVTVLQVMLCGEKEFLVEYLECKGEL